MRFSQWGYGHVGQKQPHARSHCWNVTEHTVSHALTLTHTRTDMLAHAHCCTETATAIYVAKYVRNFYLSRHVRVGAVIVASCNAVKCYHCAGDFWIITCTANILTPFQIKCTPVADLIYLCNEVTVLFFTSTHFFLSVTSPFFSPSLLSSHFLHRSVYTETWQPGMSWSQRATS